MAAITSLWLMLAGHDAGQVARLRLVEDQALVVGEARAGHRIVTGLELVDADEVDVRVGGGRLQRGRAEGEADGDDHVVVVIDAASGCWSRSRPSSGSRWPAATAAPMEAAPCCAPSQLYSLKFLSSSVPTSVTRPIFSVAGAGASTGSGVAAVASPTSRHRPLPTSMALPPPCRPPGPARLPPGTRHPRAVAASALVLLTIPRERDGLLRPAMRGAHGQPNRA